MARQPRAARPRNQQSWVSADPLAIQELAGHEDLTTTQMYMHLSPAALEDAIRLLDGDGHGMNRGEIVEAAGTENPSH